MKIESANFVYNDGGRTAAGFKGETRDCVTRALAIIARMDYQDAYDTVNSYARRGHRSARTGVAKADTRFIFASHGGVWTPLMSIGSGCSVHLNADELPKGRIVCQVSKHVVAVIDGVIHDTFDCSRNGSRCVYGYWRFPK